MNNDKFNPATLKYVYQISKRIKHQPHREDVVQDVVITLMGKDLHSVPLDDGLRNYIKGIIWNVSTSFYNKMNNKNMTFTGDYTEACYSVIPCMGDAKDRTDEMYGLIKRYVFDNYYMKEKSLTRWKVFYLRMKGYDYHFIKNKLGVTYYTALEYYSKSCIELKANLGVDPVYHKLIIPEATDFF
jgi:hypothetical protein